MSKIDDPCEEFLTLKREIDDWRSTRARVGPMPKDLWASAVEQAERYGVGAVARTLGLGHSSLGKRMLERARLCGGVGKREDALGAPCRLNDSVRRTSFVEMSGVSGGSCVETTVELSGRDGARMTLRLGGLNGIDAAGLCSAFWSRPCCS